MEPPLWQMPSCGGSATGGWDEQLVEQRRCPGSVFEQVTKLGEHAVAGKSREAEVGTVARISSACNSVGDMFIVVEILSTVGVGSDGRAIGSRPKVEDRSRAVSLMPKGEETEAVLVMSVQKWVVKRKVSLI